MTDKDWTTGEAWAEDDNLPPMTPLLAADRDLKVFVREIESGDVVMPPDFNFDDVVRIAMQEGYFTAECTEDQATGILLEAFGLDSE